MLKNLKKRNEGFTIIEVLIVLAIAGLILLVVFLAVPNLQRNSRTTQKKNDVSSLMGALQEYINNNNGTAAPGSTATPQALADIKLTQFTAINYATVAITSGTPAAATVPANISPDTVLIRNNLKCNSAYTGPATVSKTQLNLAIGNTANNIVTTQGATARSFVAVYPIEGTNGDVIGQCIDQ